MIAHSLKALGHALSLEGTLTLMSRSLRVESRLLRTYLLRLLFVGFIYGVLVIIQSESSLIGAPGLRFFTVISYLNLLFITLAGVSFFATSITEEKEEMTLGLLKMAGINSISILLGKMAPRLISAILLLSAQFPFTLLAITLGGVTRHQVLSAYFTLLAHLLLMASLGLFFSVASPRSSTASVRTTFVAIMFLLVAFWIQLALGAAIASGSISPTSWWATVLHPALEAVTAGSAVLQLYNIMITGFSQPAIGYQVVTNVAAAAVLFALSWIMFDFFNREEKSVAEHRVPLFKRIALRRTLGTRRVWGNALIWKDFHFIAGGQAVLVSKLILYALLIAVPCYIGYRFNNQRFEWDDVGQTAMIVMLIVMAVELAVYASRIFHDELKWKTWPSIALLPWTTPGLTYSKLLGCVIGILPSAFYFFSGVSLAPDSFGDAIEEMVVSPSAWLMVSLYFLFLHMTAFLSLIIKWGALPLAFVLCYVGTWMLVIACVAGPTSSDEAILGFIAFLALGASCALHIAIIVKLRELAAQ